MNSSELTYNLIYVLQLLWTLFPNYARFFATVGDENDGGGLDDVEWEDNWDDEVEGENEFAKRLRAELEKHKEDN